jgi:ubiquinone/menaquinone biosynthesis C-methylase UbiE
LSNEVKGDFLSVVMELLKNLEIGNINKCKENLNNLIDKLNEINNSDNIDFIKSVNTYLKYILNGFTNGDYSFIITIIKSQLIPFIIDNVVFDSSINENLKTDNSITNAIMEQYKGFAYPNFWRGVIPEEIKRINKDETVFSAIGNIKFIKDISFEKNIEDDELEILVAGCGTGESTLAMTKAYPDIKFTYVDISRTSLTYAMAYAKDLGLKNVEFTHADIMTMTLDKNFDIIISTGVIHHLANPSDGIKNLKRHLKNHGVLIGMIYEEYGRYEINQYRELINIVFKEDSKQNEKLEFTKNFLSNVYKKTRFGKLVEFKDINYGDNHIVDLLLNANEFSYNTDTTRILFESSGMRIINFLNNYTLNPDNYLKNEQLKSKFQSLNYYERCKTAELMHGNLMKVHFIAVTEENTFDPLSKYYDIENIKPIKSIFNNIYMNTLRNDEYVIQADYTKLYDYEAEFNEHKIIVNKKIYDIYMKFDGSKTLKSILEKEIIIDSDKKIFLSFIKKMIDGGLIFIK